MWDLVVFATDPVPGCRNLSGLIFASSIESPKSAHTSKFTSFCESVELASEVSYVLCKYADFFLCTPQTNVFFCSFDAKIGMSANLSVSQILEGGQLPNAGHALPVRPPPSRPAPPRAHTHSR